MASARVRHVAIYSARIDTARGASQAARIARRAAPELAITTTIRNTPRTTDCQ